MSIHPSPPSRGSSISAPPPLPYFPNAVGVGKGCPSPPPSHTDEGADGAVAAVPVGARARRGPHRGRPWRSLGASPRKDGCPRPQETVGEGCSGARGKKRLVGCQLAADYWTTPPPLPLTGLGAPALKDGPKLHVRVAGRDGGARRTPV